MQIELVDEKGFKLQLSNGTEYTLEEVEDGWLEIHKEQGSKAIKVEQEYAAYASCFTTKIR